MSWLSTLPGVLMAVLGISATVAVAWINQRGLSRRELIREEIRTRETLYGEFITECARLFMDAVQRTLEKPETLLPAYGLINRIRLCASKEVLAEAERLVERITEQYFAANLTLPELREIRPTVAGDPMENSARRAGPSSDRFVLRSEGTSARVGARPLQSWLATLIETPERRIEVFQVYPDFPGCLEAKGTGNRGIGSGGSIWSLLATHTKTGEFDVRGLCRQCRFTSLPSGRAAAGARRRAVRPRELAINGVRPTEIKQKIGMNRPGNPGDSGL